MKRKIALFLMILALLFASACGVLPSGTENAPDGGLIVYFIDVGQADSALLLCGGEAMLIDGGNAADSQLLYSFLQARDISHLDYVVATHAHEDHIGGLAGALNYATVGTALSPVTEYSSRVFENFVKYLGEQGLEITVPSHGDTFRLGGAEVTVVGPIETSDEPNNTSIVLRVEYGDTSFLFTGDAEREEESDILEMGYELSATVLKVGHHGSETSSSYPFLREIMPAYAVISCGTGNSYGHPHDGVLSRLRDAEAEVFRTDMQGTITCVSDGKTITFSTEKTAVTPTNPTEEVDAEEYYIGNRNSKKFHAPGCSGLPDEQNRIIFDARRDAVLEGYTPCGICKP